MGSRRRSVRLHLAAWFICVLAASPSVALNLFEWTAIAPMVIAGEVTAIDGRYVELQIERVLHGSDPLPERLFVDLKLANRSRNRVIDSRPLRLEEGKSYVVLIGSSPLKVRDSGPVYQIIRDVRGAREIPAEGRAAFFDALQTFSAIHRLKSDDGTWERFSAMLDDPNPIKQETALQQFLKFRRGHPELVPYVRPLLSHPRGDFRAAASRLAGQILTRWPIEEVSEGDALRTELIGRARTDEEIDVRLAATEALAGFEDTPMQRVLEEIAESDPDQIVRFTAEKLLHKRRSDGRVRR